jgi:hypothetical protein
MKCGKELISYLSLKMEELLLLGQVIKCLKEGAFGFGCGGECKEWT